MPKKKLSPTDEQQAVIRALLNTAYPQGIRTLRGLAKEAKLTQQRTLEILEGFSDFVLTNDAVTMFKLSYPRYLNRLQGKSDKPALPPLPEISERIARR